jgi:hypothetical protein
VTLIAVNAISDMVAPVVLLTVGGMLYKLTRLSVLTIYAALVEDEIIGRVALGLVVAGTVILLLGLGVAAMSLARSADAITYAVKRTTKFG